jgi:hypothetical protein
MSDVREGQRLQKEPFTRKGDENIAEQTLVGQDNIAGYRPLALSTIPDGCNVQERLLARLQMLL